MTVSINEKGYLNAPGILHAPRPALEHGALTTIKGIIVHQTDSDTAAATLNGYMNAGANGAHFLIDRGGTIYQVASLKKQTWHVGKLRSRCFAQHTCSPAELVIQKKNEFRPNIVNKLEMRKTVPHRYPSNNDSIGIEIVGRCILPRHLDKASLSKGERERLRGEKGVFEPVNIVQQASLQRLIATLSMLLQVPSSEIFRHPEVSRKNPTEAGTAAW
jgi:N-acetyl-anhydromuramyl-L-alanine amidase AmpD